MGKVYRIRSSWILRQFWRTAHAKRDNAPCEIVPGVFLGYVGSTTDTTALVKLNISHVLVVGGAVVLASPMGPSHFKYKRVEVLHSENVDQVQKFEECVNFIVEVKSMGGGVLVRSVAGKSRSVTVIIAYLMKTHQMSLSKALDLVWNKRPQAAPAETLLQQLQDYERHLRH